MTSIPLQGTLAELPVPKLLLDLYRSQYSGGLSLESSRIHKKLVLQEGAPVVVESDLASESLCNQLAAKGALSPKDIERVEQAQARKHYDESSALLDLGILSPRDLFVALKELVRRRTISCFGWTDGSYALHTDEEPPENIQLFRADPIALVQEGLETVWGVDRMLQALMPRMEQFPLASPALSGALLQLRTDDATDTMLGQLDGSSSLGEVLGPVVRSPRALAAAWVIDASGLVHYRNTSIQSSQEPQEAEVEIVFAPDPEEPQPQSSNTKDPIPSSQAATSSASAPAPSTPPNYKAEAMRREIQDRLTMLSDRDFYEILDVDRSATSAGIKTAYFKAAKRYHPDALARLGLDSLKRDAAEIFSLMAEAYEVLSDDKKRSDYNTSLDSNGPEIDTASLAQAETFYRKGEVLVRMGDFRGALQFLENAVQLWPDEGAYQSLLGWALYKKNPPEPQRARANLEVALSLEPDDAVTNFRLGIVLRALGEAHAAKQALARAKQLDPSANEPGTSG